MEKKGKITVYLPQKLYIEIYERNLEYHFSHLVSLLVEEFIKATDVRISWAEMPSKAEQREYLKKNSESSFLRETCLLNLQRCLCRKGWNRFLHRR
jgi:hypothetical protein